MKSKLLFLSVITLSKLSFASIQKTTLDDLDSQYKGIYISWTNKEVKPYWAFKNAAEDKLRGYQIFEDEEHQVLFISNTLPISCSLFLDKISDHLRSTGNYEVNDGELICSQEFDDHR